MNNSRMADIELNGLIKRSFNNVSIYVPIEEAIVNSIQAIKDSGNTNNGNIEVKIIREKLDPSLFEDKKKIPKIVGIQIKDDGIGFNEKNRESFKMIYSKYKQEIGGIGFGRVSYLKFFDSVKIQSSFYEENEYREINWKYDLNSENFFEPELEITNKKQCGTTVFLENIKKTHTSSFYLNFDVIVRDLVERLLPYYICDENLPNITFIDPKLKKTVSLKEYIQKEEKIKQLKKGEKEIKGKKFHFNILKIYNTKRTNSINLCAHSRIANKESMKNINLLLDDSFIDKDKQRYIIQCFVFSKYLDDNVNQERNGFFIPNSDGEGNFDEYNVSYDMITLSAINYVLENIEEQYTTRKQQRQKDIDIFFDENPYYRHLKTDLNFDKFGQNIEDIDIEQELNKIIFKKKINIKNKVKNIVNNKNIVKKEDIEKVINDISDVQKTDLSKYVIGRKLVLDLLEKNLQLNNQGKYEYEKTLHNIIFPQFKDSNNLPYKDNALWVLDEKLNFQKYICSEKKITKEDSTSDRFDLGAFGKKIAFRGSNKKATPITIFELKRPGEKKFINESTKEDPIEQITRYINGLRNGSYKMDNGIDIDADMTTPAYGYIVCSMDKKVKDWLHYDKGCDELPDGEGFIHYNGNSKLIIYIISWDKLIDDAKERNKTFFEKLGIG